MANERARALRQRLTKQEVKLWVKLRELRAAGYHFRRQDPMMPPYIVDFVCRRHRIAIEIDGSQHADGAQARSDAVRDARLAARGYRVLRFWNTEVDKNLDGVIETILAAIDDSPTRRLRRQPPHDGEGWRRA